MGVGWLQTGKFFHSRYVGNGIADNPAVHGQIDQKVGRFLTCGKALFPTLTPYRRRNCVVGVANQFIGRVLAHREMHQFTRRAKIQKQRQRGNIELLRFDPFPGGGLVDVDFSTDKLGVV